MKDDTLIENFIDLKKIRKYNKYDKERILEIDNYFESVLDHCFKEGVFIPYDLKARISAYPHAFEFLAGYIE